MQLAYLDFLKHGWQLSSGKHSTVSIDKHIIVAYQTLVFFNKRSESLTSFAIKICSFESLWLFLRKYVLCISLLCCCYKGLYTSETKNHIHDVIMM